MFFRKVFLFLLIVFFGVSLAQAAKTLFPFVAEIKANHVNVRAGESEHFDSLAKLAKGDEVVAIDQGFGWIKVQLPESAEAFISSDFVLALTPAKGVVTGKRVNVRARPTLEGFPLGQVSEGDEVILQEQMDGWYQIVPPDDFFGWIREDLLVFKKSYDPATFVAGKTKASEPIQLPAEPKEVKVETPIKEIIETPVLTERKTFRLVGRLEAQPYFEQDEIFYKLTINDQPVYILKGMGRIFDDLLYYQVELEGYLSQGGQGQYPYPVVEVEKLQLSI